MQFVVTAYDGKDDDAPARRQQARPAHLENAEKLKEHGMLLAGGAILDEDDNMIGSTMYVDFESRQALDDWLAEDPYVTQGVWQDISVQKIRLAIAL